MMLLVWEVFVCAWPLYRLHKVIHLIKNILYEFIETAIIIKLDVSDDMQSIFLFL